MRRRGPDDEGMWWDDYTVIGFRRLSILDLSPAGHQPMVSSDGRFVLAFNGEIYNFRELRAQLERDHGVRVSSSGDTAVVLAACQTWGADQALARMNGMFALSFYDRAERRLVLARDPLGIKPLYYVASSEGVAFGSQYDQVVRSPWCDRDAIDEAALGLYLRLSYVPAPYGLVAGTGQVRPGHALEIKDGVVTGEQPFFSWPEPPERFLDRREVMDELASTLEEVVARQQVSDVPVGTFLSSGIDSPLVSAVLAGRGTSAPAFTIGSDDAAFDESAGARGFANSIGLEHTTRICRGEDALALLPQHTKAYSEPFADYSSFPSMLVAELAAEQVKVVLSGDGADELFWGYPRFWKVLANRRWFERPRVVRWGAYASTKALSLQRPARGILFRTIGDWYLDSHSGLRDRDFALLTPRAFDTPPDFDLYRLSDTPDLNGTAQWMRQNELMGHLQMVLLKVDRASMHHSLEVRVPLLDLQLVKLAARIDPRDCMDGTMGKIPLRRELARRTRPDLLDAGKRGFSVPMGEWLRHELEPLVHDRLLDPNGFVAQRLGRDGLQQLYREHADHERDLTRGLWALLALQLWADEHLRPLDSVGSDHAWSEPLGPLAP